MALGSIFLSPSLSLPWNGVSQSFLPESLFEHVSTSQPVHPPPRWAAQTLQKIICHTHHPSLHARNISQMAAHSVSPQIISRIAQIGLSENKSRQGRNSRRCHFNKVEGIHWQDCQIKELPQDTNLYVSRINGLKAVIRHVSYRRYVLLCVIHTGSPRLAFLLFPRLHVAQDVFTVLQRLDPIHVRRATSMNHAISLQASGVVLLHSCPWYHMVHL